MKKKRTAALLFIFLKKFEEVRILPSEDDE